MRFCSLHLSFLMIIVLFPTVILGREIAQRHSTGKLPLQSQSPLYICHDHQNNYLTFSGHTGHIHGMGRQAVVEQKELHSKEKRIRLMERRPSTLMVAGSSLPNCSHACGSCSPCRLVMVSFICEEEAETCPMAYKCMCNSKSYPVP